MAIHTAVPRIWVIFWELCKLDTWINFERQNFDVWSSEASRHSQSRLSHCRQQIPWSGVQPRHPFTLRPLGHRSMFVFNRSILYQFFTHSLEKWQGTSSRNTIFKNFKAFCTFKTTKHLKRNDSMSIATFISFETNLTVNSNLKKWKTLTPSRH